MTPLQSILSMESLTAADYEKARRDAWETVSRDGGLVRSLHEALLVERAIIRNKMETATGDNQIRYKAELALIKRLMCPKNPPIDEGSGM